MEFFLRQEAPIGRSLVFFLARPPKLPSRSRFKMDERIIKEAVVQTERKTFKLSLRKNERGRFLRIIEEKNGYRENIIVPEDGIAEFLQKAAEVVS